MEKGVKAITLRWVRTWKLKEGKRVAKSRLVARGFQDFRDWSVPMKDAVWLHLPSDLPVEVYPGLRIGVFVRIQRAVYGLKDAPKVYTSYFKKILKVSSLG
uniref:Reverse transcriptase Ty1/copia-type domain-containing protein n=1 Tax=Chromera velia CCMP2878 TaxID=1169474 RepID=A0A0G4I9I6_9ALVE|eukprot:Cvel_12252.t1-p1 / transcript=Cvel_12252.t1 / gene=Cvel_12252 / organism=Chromera_velia_CCMP2878 / gene_product=hypothetical protein / transcript_product=hypothetical protein / location=Cvel_scaffold793:40067-40495(-) / protein_length=100 / sequence_SO=supercontig / SO=protein_coding / is_pseudo=false